MPYHCMKLNLRGFSYGLTPEAIFFAAEERSLKYAVIRGVLKFSSLLSGLICILRTSVVKMIHKAGRNRYTNEKFAIHYPQIKGYVRSVIEVFRYNV